MFNFGTASLSRMATCHPIIQEVNLLAIQYSAVDFGVPDLCGARTVAQQADCVRRGVSRTMQSYHLIRHVEAFFNVQANKGYQAGLYALAVDNVPYIGGKFVWDWEGCYQVICAVDRAATELHVAHLLTWGGAWDRRLSDFGGDVTAYRSECVAYQARHPGKDFIDGPHLELHLGR